MRYTNVYTISELLSIIDAVKTHYKSFNITVYKREGGEQIFTSDYCYDIGTTIYIYDGERTRVGQFAIYSADKGVFIITDDPSNYLYAINIKSEAEGKQKLLNE